MCRRLRTAFILTLVIAAPGSALVFQSTPAEVMKTFASTANEGQYAALEKFLAADTVTWIKSPAGQSAGGVKGICDQWTRKGTIKSFEIVKEEILGDRATVTARILYKDGSVLDPDVTRLIKENGAWKIAMGG